MWYVIAALAVALVVAVLVIVILSSALAAANKEVISLKDQAKEQQTDWLKAQANQSEALQRNERLVASLKAEIEILEKDHAACSDPTVVRARLRKLFAE